MEAAPLTPGTTTTRLASPTPSMAFRGTFRGYQSEILRRVAAASAEREHHIVAPPGAGKTVIGLELIRRFDRPAVVFAPTTTVVTQWLAQLGHFSDRPVDFSGSDPDRLTPVNVFTYQLISTPERATAELRELAYEAWLADQAATGATEQVARDRLERMRANNPEAFDREIRARAAAARRELLRADPSIVYDRLHANARLLIDRLAAAGVGTVVLDECHHLLDYWAIVIRGLIGRLQSPTVVGLTATLPDPEDEAAFENYSAILGDVDFEIPTPAVIKEGDLAPFRDIAWWVQPTGTEQAWLRDVAARFESAIAATSGSQAFRDWLAVLLPSDAAMDWAPEDDEAEPGAWNAAGGWPLGPLRWERWALDNAAASEAIVAAALAADLPVHPLARAFGRRERPDQPTLEDWLVLLERYGLDRLKLSELRADHDQLVRLRRVLAPFGLTLTEQGLRQGRSVIDLTLALSEAKALGAADILAGEAGVLGDRLRAAVITDFERQASGAGRSASPLDEQTGSAFHAFSVLAADPRTRPLGPVLVTGSTVRTTSEHAAALRDRMIADGVRVGHDDLVIDTRPLPDGTVELEGRGHDWRPGTYVGLVTRAFIAGEVHVLVGTRALLGEGWDAPALNTLVNITTVTTPTAVAQLHGRALRLDPTWPEKVAHVYDVVCVWPDLRAGGSDLDRLGRRHEVILSIVPPGRVFSGEVVRGLAHVDPDLHDELQGVGPAGAAPAGGSWDEDRWRLLDFEAANRRSLRALDERPEVRELWRIGQPYVNALDWITKLQVDARGIRTVARISRTLASIVAALVPTWIVLYIAARFTQITRSPEVLGVGVLAAAVLYAWINARTVLRAIRLLVAEEPVDAIVGDAAHAVLEALRTTGQVGQDVEPSAVEVEQGVSGTVRVSLEGASARDNRVFIRSVDEVFGPLDRARYLIRRDDGRLPNLGLWAIWIPVRWALRRTGRVRATYHAVPTALGTNRERAEAFATAWARRVGGSELVLARSAEGRAALLHARRHQPPLARRALTERWR